MTQPSTLSLEAFADRARENLDKFVEAHRNEKDELHESDWYDLFLIFISSGSR
jgi:uncharacterized iron-regulated protein